MFIFIIKINKTIIKTKYSTNSKNLNSYYVTGFCDAESCFQFFISKKKYTLGWSVKLVFSIHLHYKDVDILYQIQRLFGIGSVTINRNTANYQVVS